MEVNCDIIVECCEWSKNLIQLDSYMHSGKQFVFLVDGEDVVVS